MFLTIAMMIAATTVGGVTKINSKSANYFRNDGYAYFSGKVFVEDADYLLHADRAFVFMDSTNELKRIVALGNVAITNGPKRAYGAKASYYRNPGMVVLTSGDGRGAEVREETERGPQVVRGRKIRFWIDSKQVEVLESEIVAPTQGGGVNILNKL